jgi:hypothetical protein
MLSECWIFKLLIAIFQSTPENKHIEKEPGTITPLEGIAQIIADQMAQRKAPDKFPGNVQSNNNHRYFDKFKLDNVPNVDDVSYKPESTADDKQNHLWQIEII